MEWQSTSLAWINSRSTTKRVFAVQIKFSSLSHMITDSGNSIVKILCTMNMLKMKFVFLFLLLSVCSFCSVSLISFVFAGVWSLFQQSRFVCEFSETRNKLNCYGSFGSAFFAFVRSLRIFFVSSSSSFGFVSCSIFVDLAGWNDERIVKSHFRVSFEKTLFDWVSVISI